ncbi:MAG: class I SAM-dependent methyltransferase [Gammaproteobacteria bacterium]|nr:class I SAM-dependent methyltransferase [Gammaproteobacteria bacterium]MDH4315845.1 class I SAM-dependent methyltransferase [Gammaproteobacteria bacterium]MDH5214785.1 class I SAM-dependent methyltransferase [Gammaproteobacteria bacterium]
MNLDHWESYYRGGSLVSCPTNPEPYYTGEVRKAWAEFFAELPDGARVLDMGTGNGAVALIARETAQENERYFEIHGVDLARIDPLKYVPGAEAMLAGIQFHPGVSTEALPFDSDYFSAVGGQYILEYTDTDKSISEAYRVLKPGCACQFILHHADSIVVRNAMESLRQADFALSEVKVLRKFHTYCERARKSPSRAISARNNLYHAGALLQKAASQSTNPVLLKFLVDSISGLLANRGRLTEGQMLQETLRFERELRNWLLRLKDLASAAPAEERVKDILAAARRMGFDETSAQLQMQDGEILVGWRVALRKPS